MARLDKEKLFDQVGYRPHAGQLEIHLSPAKRRIVACGVRWGKSTAAVHEALAAVLAPTGPSRGWLVSPTFDTSDLILKRLFDLLETRFSHRVVSVDRRRRRAVITNLAGNLAEVSAKSASRPATLLGESLDWVILDEAARLKPEIWREHVSQRLVDRDGWALLASTPHRGGAWFEEEFDRCANGDEDFAAWTRPTWDNPAIDRTVVDAEKGRLGVDEFYQEFGGEFIAPGGRICPVCRWGEHVDGRILMGEQWDVCVACPECERPVDPDGKPVGMMGFDGMVLVNVYREANGMSEVHIHRDPVLQSSLEAGERALG